MGIDVGGGGEIRGRFKEKRGGKGRKTVKCEKEKTRSEKL